MANANLGAHVLVYKKNFQSMTGVVVEKDGSRYAVRSDNDGLVYDVESRNIDVITAKSARVANRSNGSTIPPVISGYPRDHQLFDFEGNLIPGVDLHVVSSWKTPRSFVGERMFAFTAIVHGHRYHGRGFGNGMLLTLRRGK